MFGAKLKANAPITAKGVSKERAVREICTQNNISMGNIMVFGDDWNDFSCCGTCVRDCT
ncbi:HAD family hydrolase [Bacillus paramycoides]|uniref:HAD family hydrolase n=1 Tax=Bacillus paramycoides TaxID=2026194 RepID=UPI002E20FEC0